MDSLVFYKVVIFWIIFCITPGPVWITVMETTRRLTIKNTVRFFITKFSTVNLFVQVPQALICVFFINFATDIFSKISLFFYISGGLYIVWLAYKTLKSKQSDTALNLSFINFAMIMLLSPKIWFLFPSGAIIANQLSDDLIINAIVFGSVMFVMSSLFFVFYVIIGKIGTKFLKNNFSYLSFWLLILFASFLFKEAIWLV